MMVRVGAVHLGWDVVSVAAGGSGVPIRPVQVEGSYNPPAYLLADASGRLYTAGVDKQRPDLGMAIPDVRDILGHPQIVIAGATWPAELVFRARLYNPLAAVGSYLRGKPDVVALPYPDDWPDAKIDAYAQLVEQLDVEVEPIPESIALSGYVRALGLVRPPDHALPDGLGATAVHFDGQVVDGRANVLVVAVHGDEERPTESVYVPIDPESTHDPRVADDTVIEVMAAARAMGADNSTVLLAGQVVFNETLRFAFRNHLGQRLKKAEHPMHALVLGATHLLVTESEDDEEPEPYPNPGPPPERPAPGAGYAVPGPGQPAPGGLYPPVAQQNPPGSGGGAGYPGGGARDTGAPGRPGGNPQGPAQYPLRPGPEQSGADRAAGGSDRPPTGPDPRGAEPRAGGPVPYGPPNQQPAPPEMGSGQEPTVKVDRGDLPPPISGPASRFTRPPDPDTGTQPAAPPAGYPSGGPGRPDRQPGAAVPPEHEGDKPKGKLWNKMKDNIFGAHAVIGAAALAVSVWGADGTGVAQAQATTPEPGVVRASDPVPGTIPASTSAAGCVPMPRVMIEPPGAAEPGETGPARSLYARVPSAPSAGERTPEPAEADAGGCERPDIDTLRYLVPGRPGVADPGPPFDV
ncbi:hypothetical protein [Nocardia sp. NPDC024068]|uniref:hypothetical protein n=1 Tax=Nocardia sp. NPDC024068 TaxID=3157197 RepID=UPI0033DBC632